jgi:hypothetical protein
VRSRAYRAEALGYLANRPHLRENSTRTCPVRHGVGKLKRSEIVRECGFAELILAQHPRRDALARLETVLVQRGIVLASSRLD